jgi:ABC-type glutathione transport system ATPase component
MALGDNAAHVDVNLSGARRDHLGVSIVHSTHDLATDYSIGDPTIVMSGSVVEAGEARTCCRSPQHPYSRSVRSSDAAGRNQPSSPPADDPSTL